MNEVYYDASNVGGYGGVQKLSQATASTIPETQTWLRGQRVCSLHKPARKRYATRRYKTAGIDQQWQADLVEMIPYERERMMVIGIYSLLLTCLVDMHGQFLLGIRQVWKSLEHCVKFLHKMVVNLKDCRRMRVENLTIDM